MDVNCTTFGCSIVSTGFDVDCHVYSPDCNPCFLSNCTFSEEATDECLVWYCTAWTTTTTAAPATTTAAPRPPPPTASAITAIILVAAFAVILLLTTATAWASQTFRLTLTNGFATTATGLRQCWLCCSRQDGAAAYPPAFQGQFHGDGDEEDGQQSGPSEPAASQTARQTLSNGLNAVRKCCRSCCRQAAMEDEDALVGDQDGSAGVD
jgi:hypothetical protein